LTNRAEYIREARVRYDSYDNEWVKAVFDEHSGGFCVYHKRHNFDPTIGIFGIPRGNYELIASEILAKYGMNIALQPEKLEYDSKIPDGFLNGKLFDIKGVEGIGKENILKDIKDASKKGAEIVVLYYHKNYLFNEAQMRENYHTYLRNSNSKRIQQVYYIVDKKLYALK